MGNPGTALPAAGEMTSRRFGILVGACAVAGLVVRLVYVYRFRLTVVSSDGLWYHEGANLLADGKGFLNPYGYTWSRVTQPGANHPPAWTAVLSMGSFVGLKTWRAHQLLACCVGTATIPTLGFAGRRLAGPWVGVIAALFAALYPNFWMYESMLLSETLVILVAAVTILLALRFNDSPSMRGAVAVGAACGVLTLVRAEQILLFAFLLVPLALFVRNAARRDRLRWLAAALGAGCLVIAPWIAFNLSRFQEPAYLTTNFGEALAESNCPSTYHGARIGSWNPWCANAARASIRIHAGFDEPAQLDARHEDYSTLDAAERRFGLRYMRGHISALPAVVLAREGRTWNVFRPFQQMHLDLVRGDVAVLYPGLFAYWLLLILAVGGVIVLRRRTMQLIVLGSFIATVIVTTAITFGQTRYRAPADVSLVLFAAVAVDALGRRFSMRAPHRTKLALP